MRRSFGNIFLKNNIKQTFEKGFWENTFEKLYRAKYLRRSFGKAVKTKPDGRSVPFGLLVNSERGRRKYSTH